MKTMIISLLIALFCAFCCVARTVSKHRGQHPQADTFVTVHGKPIHFYCIKHGSVRIQVDNRWVYVDPVGKGIKPETDYSKLPKADVILITHEHGDHLDEEAIACLTKEGTQIIANQAGCRKLKAGQAMTPGDVCTLEGGMEVKAVAAYNCTEGHQHFHPKGRDNGYLITFDGFVVYIAGDTEDIPELEELPKNIDVAFLPCNQPYTMTVEQLVSAAQTIAPKVLFPYHYSDTDLSHLQKKLEGSGVEVRIRQYR